MATGAGAASNAEAAAAARAAAVAEAANFRPIGAPLTGALGFEGELHNFSLGPLGWILVFDLDQTVAGNPESYRSGAGVDINPNVLEVLRKALAQKASGIVTGIFLLTNNSSTTYVDAVHETLKGMLGVPVVFDKIMTAWDAVELEKRSWIGQVYPAYAKHVRFMDPPHQRTRPPMMGFGYNYAYKTLEDVRAFVKAIGKSDENLEQRVLFFDDYHFPVGHQIKNEIREPGLYVFVNPPYDKTNPPGSRANAADFTAVLGKLDELPDLGLGAFNLPPSSGGLPLEPGEGQGGGRRRRVKHSKTRRSRSGKNLRKLKQRKTRKH